MAIQKFTNNYDTTLSSPLAIGGTSMDVTSATKAPTIAVGDWSIVTLVEVDPVSGLETDWEIVKVTAIVGTTFTIERAQEGTTDRAWDAGSVVSLRDTASFLEGLGTDRHVPVTLATNHGLGLTGQALSMGTPSTLTASTTNAVTTTTHSHAITGFLTSLSGAVLTDQTSGQTIGATGTRLTMLWATDITCTNAISGSVTGNAGTVTNGVYTGGAGTVFEVPLTFSNSVSRSTNTVSLVNDSAAPGNSYYYGTNGSGAKGFFALPSSLVYPGAGIALSTGSAWSSSITDNSANWNTAYGWGNHASAGYVKTDQTSGQTIGATGARLTMLWATDITCTNSISGSVTGNAGTVTNATFTTAFTNQGGAGVLAWPAAGATLTIPTGGGTLGTAAFTAASAYAASSHTQAVSTISDATTVGQNIVKLTNPSAINFVKIAADNTVSSETAANHRTSIGATTVGGNLFTLTNPSAITFLKVAADNTVSAESASTHLTSLGAAATGQTFYFGTTQIAINRASATLALSGVTFDSTTLSTAIADNTSTTQADTTAYAKGQDAVLRRHPTQAVNLTYASSSATGIAIADNDNIDVGTTDFTLAWVGSLPDWTPLVTTYIMSKQDSANGYILSVLTTGALRLSMYRPTGTSYTTTALLGFIDGTSHSITALVTRETASIDGSIAFYVDGVLFETVAIDHTVADAGATLSSTDIMYVCGYSTKRYVSTVSFVAVYNRLLTGAQVLAMYRNGITYSDKWGSTTAKYTSDFSVDVNGWIATRGTVAGNIDSIGGENDWLRFTITDTTSNTHHVRLANTLLQNKKYRLSLKYYIPSGQTNAYGFAVFEGSVALTTPWIQSPLMTVQDTVTSVSFEFETLPSSTWNGILYIAPYVGTSTTFQDAGGDDIAFYIKEIVLTEIGATLALQPEGINSLNWLDSSTNLLNATYPTAGSSLTRPAQGLITLQSGNNGIGVADPASLLELQGGLTTTGSVLTLGTKEPTVVANDILGRINFYAPLEADGSDAILPGASIAAIAEDTFSTTVNKTSLLFQTGASETATTKMLLTSTGRLGIGLSPTAVIHLKAGTAAATTAPLKFTSGELLGTAEAGAIEFLTDRFYATITTGAARKTLAFLDDITSTGSSVGSTLYLYNNCGGF